MYNIAFTGLIAMLVFLFVKLDQDAQIMIQTLSVFWASTFSSIAFYLPRILQARKDRDKKIPTTKTAAAIIAHDSSNFIGNNRNNHESTACIDDEVVELRKNETDHILSGHDGYHIDTVDDRHIQSDNLDDVNNDLVHHYAFTKDDIMDGSSPSEMYRGPEGVLGSTEQETVSFSKDESNVLFLNPTPENARNDSDIM